MTSSGLARGFVRKRDAKSRYRSAQAWHASLSDTPPMALHFKPHVIAAPFGTSLARAVSERRFLGDEGEPTSENR